MLYLPCWGWGHVVFTILGKGIIRKISIFPRKVNKVFVLRDSVPYRQLQVDVKVLLGLNR